ncbi:flagellar hook-basal body complex protein [Paludibacterium denitrificans]|uniref:flagellar hook-basal body complex protein n=1 Tax=Paludibacterium denitrificans TaxID=2675226 RepID=UPI0028B06D70|nr:flagellar hook-basal body complex protein [Paludibacterium denitrificans]
MAAQASSRVSYVGNLSADWSVPAVTPFDKTDPQTFNSSVVSTVYDSLGTQHTLTQYFVKTGSNQVDVHYAFDGSDLATASTLSFGTDGQLTAPAAPVTVALGTPAGAAALSVDVNYLGTTQFAGQTTTSANSTDGYASGTFTGVALTEDGSIQAQYSNGQKQTVGMLALAGFPNEGGLTPVSGTSSGGFQQIRCPAVFHPRCRSGGQAGHRLAGTV